MTQAKNYRVMVVLLLIAFSMGMLLCLYLGKVSLFSKISGVIMLDGQPAVNARLVRATHLSKDITDETTTDDKGYFEMPAMFTRTITKYLPQEFVARQEIIAFYQNRKYRICSSVKRNPEENTESKGKPLIVNCELNNDEEIIMVNNVTITSRYTWNVKPHPKKEYF